MKLLHIYIAEKLGQNWNLIDLCNLSSCWWKVRISVNRLLCQSCHLHTCTSARSKAHRPIFQRKSFMETCWVSELFASSQMASYSSCQLFKPQACPSAQLWLACATHFFSKSDWLAGLTLQCKKKTIVDIKSLSLFKQRFAWGKRCPVPSCMWLASFRSWPKRSHKDKPHITILLTIRKRAAACKIQQLCGMSQALKRNIWLLEVSTLQIFHWVLSSVFSMTVGKVWSS